MVLQLNLDYIDDALNLTHNKIKSKMINGFEKNFQYFTITVVTRTRAAVPKLLELSPA